MDPLGILKLGLSLLRARVTFSTASKATSCAMITTKGSFRFQVVSAETGRPPIPRQLCTPGSSPWIPRLYHDKTNPRGSLDNPYKVGSANADPLKTALIASSPQRLSFCCQASERISRAKRHKASLCLFQNSVGAFQIQHMEQQKSHQNQQMNHIMEL